MTASVASLQEAVEALRKTDGSSLVKEIWLSILCSIRSSTAQQYYRDSVRCAYQLVLASPVPLGPYRSERSLFILTSQDLRGPCETWQIQQFSVANVVAVVLRRSCMAVKLDQNYSDHTYVSEAKIHYVEYNRFQKLCVLEAVQKRVNTHALS